MLAAKRVLPSSVCHRCNLRLRIASLQQRRLRSTHRSPEVEVEVGSKESNDKETNAIPVRYYATRLHGALPQLERLEGSSFIRKDYTGSREHKDQDSALKRWGLDQNSQNNRQDSRFREALMECLKKVQYEVKDAPVLKQLSKDIAGDEEEQDRGTGVVAWPKEGRDDRNSFDKLWRKFTSNILEGGQKGEKKVKFMGRKAVTVESSPNGAEMWHDLRDAYATRGVPGLEDRIKYMFYGHVTGKRFTATDVRNQKILADLRYPTEWYPATRTLQREIHLHVGPTNSGKTYHALKRLEQAKSGAYAGPLRLLAHEVYTRLNAKGIGCALVTGEERRAMDFEEPENNEGVGYGASAYKYDMMACTVEMVPLNKTLDVCVIDEIQMIGNAERGWAWTQALLGVKAKEVHLCGEERTVPLIRELCASMGEKLTIHKYERLSPLMVADSSLDGDLRKLRKGDCIVAFSVMGIHALRKQIEVQTGKKVATVYGSLPPETRAQQARLFNDPDNDYDYLVASDAVGMGLNLAIKRVIFEAANKFDGISRKTLAVADIKQIGGRAGRFRTAAQVNQDVSEQELAAAKGETPTREIEREVIEPVKEVVRPTPPAQDSPEESSSTPSDPTSDSDVNTSVHDLLRDYPPPYSGPSFNNIPSEDPVPSFPPPYSAEAREVLRQKSPSGSNIYTMPPSGDVPNNIGIITTLERFDYPIVLAAMSSEPEPIHTAGLFPPGAVLERFSSYFPPGTPFSYILTRLHDLSQMHSRFHLCGLRDQVWIADLIEPVTGLTVSDRNIICSSPAGKSDDELWSELMPEYARAIAEQTGGELLSFQSLPLEILDEPVSMKRGYLKGLERLHKGIVAYLWLSYRFAGIFTTRGLATHVKGLVEDKIETVLKGIRFSEQGRRKVKEGRERAFLEGLEIESEVSEASGMKSGASGVSGGSGEEGASVDQADNVVVEGESVVKRDEDFIMPGDALDVGGLDRQSGLLGSEGRFGGEVEDVIFEEDDGLEEGEVSEEGGASEETPDLKNVMPGDEETLEDGEKKAGGEEEAEKGNATTA